MMSNSRLFDKMCVGIGPTTVLAQRQTSTQLCVNTADIPSAALGCACACWNKRRIVAQMFGASLAYAIPPPRHWMIVT